MATRLNSEEDDSAELHEINVTPFIDVMLVLLIIFMVAAPLSTVDIGVDLPVSNAKPQPRPDKPLFLTIKADLTLALGNDPVARRQLASALDAATQMDRQKRLFLREARGQRHEDFPADELGVDHPGALEPNPLGQPDLVNELRHR